MKKKIIIILSAFFVVIIMTSFSAIAYNGWADTYLSYCIGKGIISGDENGNLMPDDKLTREQMAKMVLNALDVKIPSEGRPVYADVNADRWSYAYITKYHEYVIEDSYNFLPEENVTREEFLAMAVKIAGFGEAVPKYTNVFVSKFSDWDEIDDMYYRYILIGFEKNFVQGSDGRINPKSYLTRAEACALLYRICNSSGESVFISEKEKDDEKNEEIIPVFTTSTPIAGKSEATLEQAMKWAESRGADQRYIDIASYYWEYGEITGIRADVLYAQAAKETAFGKYTGQVKPEQNNWAGIKKYGATGDLPEDHEDFATPEDGVRGHFNHMCAYIGAEPVGEPHGRYKSVKSLSWAGTVETVEQLGAKWCPDIYYGANIVSDFLAPMINTVVK